MINFILHLPSILAVKLIELYQATLSPDHGLFKGRYPYGFCRHYPSCSEYSKRAITKYGLIKGIILSAIRVGKCNPWAKPEVSQNI